MNAKYLNPFTDFGFKKIFGEEASKPALIDFLNTLLPAKDQITSIQFQKNEQLGQTEFDRKAIFDIFCENQNGEKFIVELQKAKQNFFKDRSVYYATFPIQEQAQKGEWDYRLKSVYCIGVLDFEFDKLSHSPQSEVVTTVQLKNQKNDVFYDKLTMIYLEMPRFKKSLEEIHSRQDMWFYFIKNLEDLQDIPAIFHDRIFEDAFDTASLAVLPADERLKYENSLKNYRDLKSVLDTAFDDGKAEGEAIGIQKGKAEGEIIGIQKGKTETTIKGVLLAYDFNIPVATIAEKYEISVDEVQRIIAENQ